MAYRNEDGCVYTVIQIVIYVFIGSIIFPGLIPICVIGFGIVILGAIIIGLAKYILSLMGVAEKPPTEPSPSQQYSLQTSLPLTQPQRSQAAIPQVTTQTYRPVTHTTVSPAPISLTALAAAQHQNIQTELPPKQKLEPGFSYRPIGSAVPGFSMKDLSDVNAGSIKEVDFKDIQDAFTGALLDTTKDIYKCAQCKVYYQMLSIQVLREENEGRCVSCRSKEIRLVKSFSAVTRGINFVPTVVTLSNFKNYIGQTITFEGYVPRVNVSRDGRSYAVMFENTAWNNGLKMTVFKGTVRAAGGSKFLKSLQGRNIRLRGLLTSHPTFGYQIVVSEKEMILEVR